MQFLETGIPDVKIVVPQRIGDARGFFSEVWNARDFASAGIGARFVQDNHVRSPHKGTLRGLHYQIDPAAQGKLLRVTRGAVFERRRRHPARIADLRALCGCGAECRQLASALDSPGFAHGYCTLEDGTEVQYKVTGYYSPAHDRGIAWDDRELTISWPVTRESVILSERDRKWPRLAEQPDLFEYRP